MGPSGVKCANLDRTQDAVISQVRALRLAGFDRFALDRLAVDGLQPAGPELNALLGVLDQLAELFRCWE